MLTVDAYPGIYDQIEVCLSFLVVTTILAGIEEAVERPTLLVHTLCMQHALSIPPARCQNGAEYKQLLPNGCRRPVLCVFGLVATLIQ